MTGPGDHGQEAGGQSTVAPAGPRELHAVELVGAHLRVTGHLALGRFPRLADLVNHNRGFIVIQDAQVLDPGGRPTGLALPELAVNQDEISFIGHASEAAPPAGRPAASGPHPVMVFTPGHTIDGGIHLYRDISLANFVEATDPRFVEVIDASARAKLDPGTTIQYGRMLVNRTQITAIAQLPDGGQDPASPAEPRA